MRTTLWRLLAAALLPGGLCGQVGDSSERDQLAPPPHWKIPAAPVRTPEESMRLFDLPPGFRVELVAAEPLVQDPIAMSFDERGRLWVLEWPSYNRQLQGIIPGLENPAPPKARLVMLADEDGDGRMDRRTVFLAGSDWPRGFQLWRDGALVLMLPELVAARDRDGDGTADQREILVDGLAIPGNPHAAQSNLLRSLDNWIYGSGFPRRLRETGGTWISRPHLRMGGQWGLSQDNYGRLFYSYNGDHLRGNLVPAHYYSRNPHYPNAAGVDVRYPQDQTVWPHGPTPGVNRRNQLRDQNGTLRIFTSNTAPIVYRGDQFPRDFVGNVFLGDVAGRLIRRSVLTETEGIITARNAYSEREFLFSHDERFRPVFTANGPDGALYVADMYRGIIEGHLFITTYLRNQILGRGLQQPMFGLGRIYRIVHQSGATRTAPRFNPDQPLTWVEYLAHPNGFWRDTAQRLIVERGDRRLILPVRAMALGHADELARLHALWTLEGLDALDPQLLLHSLADRAPQVRMAAIRLAETFWRDAPLAGKVLSLTEDERIEVRRQLLFSLGEGRGGGFEQAMLRLLRQDAAQPFMVEAALSGLHEREYAFLEIFLQDVASSQEKPGFGRIVSALAHAILNAGNQPDVDRLLQETLEAAGRPWWVRRSILEGLEAANKKGLARVPPALAELERSADESLRARAQALGKAWSTPAPAGGTAEVRSRAVAAGFDKGQSLFAICSACHGGDGRGQPNIAPSLAESRVVAGPADELIRVVLHGRNQDRRNPAFPDMPPLGGLRDDNVAAVVSYVRARWGGQAQAVTADDVRRVRDHP